VYTSSGYSVPITIGTPRLKVAVAWVAESMTTESADTLAKTALTLNSASYKLVPVKTIVESVLVAEATAGNVVAVC